MKQETLPSIMEQLEDMAEASEASSSLPGQYTGERVRRRDPERYQAIIDMLADGGMGINRIGKLTKTHPATIIAIRDASPELIEAGKKRVARLARSVAQLTVESMLDTMADPEAAAAVPFSQRAIAYGILTDKAQLADGGPTEIVRHDCPSFEDFNAQLRAATGRGGEKTDKGGAVDAEFVDLDDDARPVQVPGQVPRVPGDDAGYTVRALGREAGNGGGE